MDEDFEPRRVPGQLEQPQDSDNREELQDVGFIGDPVGHAAVQNNVCVKAEGRHEVYHVHRRLDEVKDVRRHLRERNLVFKNKTSQS